MNDKMKHLLAGAFVAVLVMATLALKLKMPISISAVCALLVAFAGGAVKELIWDKKLDQGTPDASDIWATTAGGLFGVVLWMAVSQ